MYVIYEYLMAPARKSHHLHMHLYLINCKLQNNLCVWCLLIKC